VGKNLGDNMAKTQVRKRSEIIYVILMTAVLMLFTGCKKKSQEEEDYLGDIRTNTMTINADGSILEVACQDFSGVTYDISGLEETIKTEVDDYRAKYGETEDNASVKLLQYENSEGFVRAALQYANLESYNNFNNTDYADGDAATVTSDFASDTKLTDLGGNEVLLADVVNSGYKAFTIDGDYTLTLNGSVLYYNQDAVMGGSGSTVVTDGLETAVIIYQ
jgi:hypothetical protein